MFRIDVKQQRERERNCESTLASTVRYSTIKTKAKQDRVKLCGRLLDKTYGTARDLTDLGSDLTLAI